MKKFPTASVALLLVFSLFANVSQAGHGGLEADSEKPAASSSTCHRQLTTWQTWRRRLVWTGVSLAGMTGGYLGVEYASTEPNYRQSAQFDPTQVDDETLNIAVFGDSLARGDGYMPLPQNFWSIRTNRSGWPMDHDAKNGSVSLYERIVSDSPKAKLKVTNYAWPGAYVDPAVNQSGAVKQYGFKVKDFRAQVSEAVHSPGPMPNVNIFFMGHNNTDWYYDIHTYNLDPERYRKELPGMTVKSYEAALEPLIAKALEQDHEVTFLVYGLINFKSVFVARNEAMEYKKTHPEAYPSSDVSATFPSLLEEHQPTTIEVANEINDGLREMVARLSDKLAGRNVRIHYSDALATADFSKVEYLAKNDGLHPSDAGKTHISKIVYDDLREIGILKSVSRK